MAGWIAPYVDPYSALSSCFIFRIVERKIYITLRHIIMHAVKYIFIGSCLLIFVILSNFINTTEITIGNNVF